MSNIILRTILLYLLLTLCIRLMGKRSLGDLQPSEMVTTILVSNIAVLPLENPEMKLLHSLLPIGIIAALEMLYAIVSLRFPKLRRLVIGSPVVVIRDGVIQQKNLRRLRCTIDDLYASMRLAGYFDITEIAYAIAETTGNISFLPQYADTPVTAKMMHLKNQKLHIPLVLISDGNLMQSTVRRYHIRRDWLDKVLKANGVSVKQVFLMTVDESLEYTLIRRE